MPDLVDASHPFSIRWQRAKSDSWENLGGYVLWGDACDAFFGTLARFVRARALGRLELVSPRVIRGGRWDPRIHLSAEIALHQLPDAVVSDGLGAPPEGEE